MVPEDCAWNYNLMGSAHSPSMRYSVRMDQPKDFYHESHRPSHFLNFAEMEETTGSGMSAADMENVYE